MNIEKLTYPEPSKLQEVQTRSGSRASRRHSPELILIVDDDQVIRESLAEVLRSENYAVRLAGDGYEAVRQFLKSPPDLTLLDLNMPDVSGWRVFEIMAALYPFVQVILITARPGQAERAAKAGINVLMEKPLDIPVLLKAIRRLLDQPDAAPFERVLRVWRKHDEPGLQK